MRVNSYSPRVMPYQARQGINIEKTTGESLTAYQRMVQREIAEDALKDTEWKAKPDVVKAGIVTWNGLKKAGTGIKDAWQNWVVDSLNGTNFQLFINGKIIETDKNKFDLGGGPGAWEK
jgi:hypothetical protein